ncbi:MAG: PAS domain S-box protein, partial [Deltaproteobacteria bacterium]|nr:PAS domain S-box protein [Deltaproteobacteria bacterium]
MDYRGVPVLAHLRAVPGSPWYLVARMDLSEANAPVRERLRQTVFLDGVLLLAAATGVGLLWRRQRARFYKERYEAEREKSWLQDVISRSLNEIYVFDSGTLRFKYVNAGGLRNLGYGMEELSGMTPVDIKPRVTEEMFRDMIRPLVAGERDLLVFETVHGRKDGSEYPVEVHLQLVPSADGAVFLAIINDITDRKAAEERVREGGRLETALHRIDTQILEGSNLREVLGTVCEAIVESGYRLCWVGQPGSGGKVLPIAWAGPSAGYIEDIDLRWDRSAEGSGPLGTAVRTGKPCLVRDISGDPVFAPWRDRALRHGLLSMAAVPLAFGEGNMAGIMNVYADRRDAFGEEEIARLETFARQCSIALLNAQRIERLRDADQRLTFHVDRMPLAYIVWDREFRAREWNPAAERIFGWKAEEALGMPGDEIVPPEARAHVGGAWARLLESGDPGYSLNANIRKDGKVIACEWFNTPLRDASGNITGVLSMAHDVTEKAELQRQLQTAQRMEAVGTLAGGIAHDFNNALTGIFGFAEMLKAQLADNPRALADLDQILRSAERASLLTRQILTFARRQVIELSNVGMNRVVEELIKLFSRVVGAHIEIRTSLEKDLPSIRADAGQIEQVVMNLVLNARDAMPGGGRLMIVTGLERIDAEY